MQLKERITQIAQQAIQDKVFPGCVVGIAHVNGEREVIPVGHFTYDTNAAPVREDTIYDVASLTKSLCTGSLALQLLDEGRIKLTDKLIDYIPEFNNSDRDAVLIKHLLTYTLDGYGLGSLQDKSANALIHTLMTHDFERRPGTVFKYTNIPAALMGLVIERITHKTLDVLCEAQFLKPLGMSRTTFYPERLNLGEVVPTEIDNWRGRVHGVVHDESAYIAKQHDVIVGHAGLFSTAPDILNFMEMLLHKGKRDGKRYLSEDMVAQMHTNQIADIGECTGLGWELNQPRYMGEFCTTETFGKTGFTGTLCIADISKGVAYVILSNRIYPQRPADSTAINAFRKQIGEIILK